MWVTAFIAAYTLYRHHRVLDAILLVGALLIANMSATLTDLFPYLVLFMLAALLLWLRAALDRPRGGLAAPPRQREQRGAGRHHAQRPRLHRRQPGDGLRSSPRWRWRRR